MSRATQRALVAGLLSTTFLSVPVVSFAQSGEGAALEEVIVTATRRSETIVDVPYNISAVSGANLERSQVTDINALAQRLPGVAIVDTGPRGSAMMNSIVIRGIGTEGAGGLGAPNASADTVSVYLGETPLYTNLPIKDIARVEVLRGPQGTLYGSGSLGGTLRFIYNRPEFDSFGANTVAVVSKPKNGETGYSLDAVVNAPLNDRVALRLVGSYERQGGFIDQPFLFKRDSDDGPATLADPSNIVGGAPVLDPKENTNWATIYYGRASLRAQPSEIVDLQLNYQFQRTRVGDGPATNPDYMGHGRYDGSNRVTEKLSGETQLVDLDASVDFGFATLTSTTSYYDSDVEGRRDNTALFETAPFGELYLGNPRFFAEAFDRTNRSGWVQELRLASNGESRFQYVGGFFYQTFKSGLVLEDILPGYSAWRRAEGSDPFTGDPLPPGFSLPNDADFITEQNDRFKEYALFGELTYNITDRWQVTGGARFFKQDFRTRAFFSLPQTEFIFGVSEGRAEGAGRAKINDSIFKVNTSYEIKPGLRAYAVFSQGFRRGGANGLPTVGPFGERAELNLYRPDTLDNYEIGLKGRLGRQVNFTVAAFHQDWKDIQLTPATVAASQPFVTNAGDATSRGFEVEATVQVTPALSVNGGYSYTDATLAEDFEVRTLRYSNGDQSGSIAAAGRKGQRTPGSAKHTATIAADYRHDLADDNALLFHADASYRSSVLRNLERESSEAYFLDGYALVNGSVSYETTAWTLGAFVSNVFDERGVNAVDGDTPTVVSRHRAFYITRPRTIGLRLAVRFGGEAR